MWKRYEESFRFQRKHLVHQRSYLVLGQRSDQNPFLNGSLLRMQLQVPAALHHSQQSIHESVLHRKQARHRCRCYHP